MRSWFRLGPATLVAAAFIGPGTVVTASLAGANYGYALLWALLFSVLATMILQEMAARLGIVTGMGLGENLRQLVAQPALKFLLFLLVIAAIVIGNSAYQGGNITGASLGADAIWGDTLIISSIRAYTGLNPWALLIGTLAVSVLWHGNYRLIERCLIGLVLLMSLAFVSTMLLTRPDYGAMLQGLLLPAIPRGATLTVIALIGTTVVPYSLFLHAASSANKWQGVHNKAEALQQSNADLRTSIPLGGLISLAVVSTAATAYFGRGLAIENAADLAVSLEPLFGQRATYLMALGLLAAGLSSAVTAPLAAAYALRGILQLSNLHFRLTWLTIILIGVVVSSLGLRPVSVIWFAQVANGILLPVITFCLLAAMNMAILGRYRNNWRQNIVGGLVFVISLLLSGRSLWLAFAS
ncbi:Nramp family divalent metal transporter [Alkalimonas amylolytica]|uniref:NRAMP (Natural resistance-associated macrophage protein) metal ion transporters n=1 Tax=Alkalimonas amylolytica TaxID=152573 RepID=A0A1H4BD87_ALKAM|nr:Nramp family divalent metal transporter [Alkalimonas amylolytica]SEA46101.1 NRAMP (natural resistance-associated macrophage protein) metal ion transporters [Alkalimonas amylolytica]